MISSLLQDDEKSVFDRLIEFTVINPEGKFHRLWLDFMFFVSVIAGLYSTFIAFFTTTPGERKQRHFFHLQFFKFRFILRSMNSINFHLLNFKYQTMFERHYCTLKFIFYFFSLIRLYPSVIY